MSSTRFSQRIVVFSEGKIIQTGNHQSLIARPGLYQELFNAQGKYYVNED